LFGFVQVSGQGNGSLFGEGKIPATGSLGKLGPQKNGKFIVDSTYYYFANLFGQTWLNTGRYKVTQRDKYGNFETATNWLYDTIQLNWFAGNTYEASYFDSVHTSKWIANVWDLKVEVWRMSDSISYRPDGSPAISWYKVWNPESWKFLRGKRVTYFYLGNGNTEKEYTQVLDTLTRLWENSRQDFYAYNTHDLLQEDLIKTWDTLNLVWSNSELIKYTYDENDLLTEQINQEWAAGSLAWQNSFKADFFYDATGRPYERFVYEWIDATGVWRNMDHTINKYNESSLLSEVLTQYWDESENAWIDNVKINYEYDTQGNKTSVVYQYWDLFGYWFNLSMYTYTYDGNGNRTDYLYRSWDFINNIWEDFYKEASFWSEFIPFSVNDFDAAMVKVFPNPANDFVNIIFKTEVKNAFCYLFSEDGKLLKTQHISGNTNSINTSGFLPGIYILKIETDERDFSQKIILK
jgi:hypothetical protein